MPNFRVHEVDFFRFLLFFFFNASNEIKKSKKSPMFKKVTKTVFCMSSRWHSKKKKLTSKVCSCAEVEAFCRLKWWYFSKQCSLRKQLFEKKHVFCKKVKIDSRTKLYFFFCCFFVKKSYIHMDAPNESFVFFVFFCFFLFEFSWRSKLSVFLVCRKSDKKQYL